MEGAAGSPSRGRGNAGVSWANAPAPEPVTVKPSWKQMLAKILPKGAAPGQEKVMSSPLVFGLVIAFLVLVVVGFQLYGVIRKNMADKLYNQALENLDNGDYRNAIKRFDEFLDTNKRTEPRAGKVRVLRALANVQQYASSTGTAWDLALEAEREMFQKVADLPEYLDSRADLDDLILKTGTAFADRAKASSDKKALALAEETVTLHNQVADKSMAETLLKKSRLAEKLAEAHAAVRKTDTRASAHAAMDAALAKESAAGVFAARDALIASYPDQAKDRELIARMTKATDLVKKGVKFDDSQRPAQTGPRPEAFGPPTNFVMRSADAGPPAGPTADGPVVFATADGYAFGVDGISGAPLWQTAIGLSSPFSPQAIAGGTVPTALAFDARHNELVRLKAKTGELVWRQSIGEPIVAPPLVVGNQILQPTPTGKLLIIDLTSGAVRGTLDLGTRLSGSAPVADESGQNLYLTAEKDSMFILTRDPIACTAVVYLGQEPGSIPCPPARVGRYLIVPENNLINEGRWRVFMLSEDGSKATSVQDVTVPGWTWGTPASAGSVVWATGDRGGVMAIAVGAYGEKDPFRMIARVNPDAEPSGPAYALAKSERDLWVASGRSARFELNAEAGKLNQGWTLREAGPALAPPQSIGGRLVLTQQYNEGPGASLWCVDPQTGAVKWRTVLGAAWPAPPQLAPGGQSLTALGVDGKLITLTPESLAKGGFIESTLPKPGIFRIPPGSLARLDGEGWSAVIPALKATKLLVRIGADDYKEVPLPARIGATPIVWGPELFVPGDDGRAYLIDPKTGESRAEPFVPPFDRTRPTHWRAPVALGSDAVALADDAGHVRRLVRQTDPRPSLIVSAEASLGKGLDIDPASTTGAVVLVSTDGKVHSLSAKDLSPAGVWTLESPLAVGPASAGGKAYVTDLAGGIMAIGADGQQLWKVKLEGGAIVATPPSAVGDTVRFLTRDGTIFDRSSADGSAIEKTALGILPAESPITLGKELAVPVGLGTIRLVRASASLAKADNP
jgi:outer membrane protein assembly factor BamB